MMSPYEIQMCVADVIQDDDIESIESILRSLNHQYESSWQATRGTAFTEDEVRAALVNLIEAGLVTPCAEQPPSGECSPIPANHIGTEHPWADVWFHLETPGREAVRRWWEAEGQAKYPLVE
jgi:hypothetical protein